MKRWGLEICKLLKTNGGAEGGRTPDLGIANAALCQTELLPHKRVLIIKIYGKSVKWFLEFEIWFLEFYSLLLIEKGNR